LKIKGSVQSMIDRGLLEVRPDTYQRPHAYFTDRGLDALRLLLSKSRMGLGTGRYDHLWEDLGLPPPGRPARTDPPPGRPVRRVGYGDG
jgi:hypothetical protein